MELSQLTPTASTVYLRLLGQEITLNPVTLSDEIWLEETFKDGIVEIFEKVNMVDICRIVFRLMCDEDKLLFKVVEKHSIDEEGLEITTKIGGAKLLNSYISGWDDKSNIIGALVDTIGASRPAPDDSKKKEQILNQPTGQ